MIPLAKSTLGRGTLLMLLAFGAFVYVMALAPRVAHATQSTFDNKGLELKIDSKAWYNGVSVPSATWGLKDLTPGTDKFWNYPDVKPGDYGCNVISIHVKKQDAWACIDFKNQKNLENGITESEAPEDPNGSASGELGDVLEFFGWLDDGDGKYEPPGEKALFGTSTQAASIMLNEKTYAIGDSKSSACQQDKTKYISACWCAGDLVVNMQTGKITCDGSRVGNGSQTDTMTLDVLIRAVPSADDKKFVCTSGGSGGNGGGGGGGGNHDPHDGHDGHDGHNGGGNWHQVITPPKPPVINFSVKNLLKSIFGRV